MSYRRYMTGEYDEAVATFFSLLQRNGVDTAMMGTWVPFPESNTPSWDNKDTEPRDFAVVVNKYLRSMKAVYPDAKASVLLNATTYEPTDIDYENGDYINLIPYVEDIDTSLVSSIGIQGFPWVSRATQARREIFRASEFLQPDNAVEAAKHLRTRDIWFNTGVFSTKYATDPEQLVRLSDADRKAILEGIVQEVKYVQELQQNQYRVSVNIFAEDKSETTEATDWSFLPSSSSKSMFKNFINQLHKADVTVSLYDK